MNLKRYMLVFTVLIVTGFGFAGAAFACSDGESPPPDTHSIQIESPTS